MRHLVDGAEILNKELGPSHKKPGDKAGFEVAVRTELAGDAAVAQQGVDGRLPATEGAEQLHRRT